MASPSTPSSPSHTASIFQDLPDKVGGCAADQPTEHNPRLFPTSQIQVVLFAIFLSLSLLLLLLMHLPNASTAAQGGREGSGQLAGQLSPATICLLCSDLPSGAGRWLFMQEAGMARCLASGFGKKSCNHTGSAAASFLKS